MRQILTKLKPCFHGSTTANVLDFSTNTYPVRLPDDVVDAIEGSIRDAGRYPESDSKTLREKIADHVGVSPRNIIVGNGSTELIRLISFCFRGNSFIPQPTYSEYEFSNRLYGNNISFSRIREENEFLFDEETLRVPAGTDLVFLCNPNNPTGRRIPKKLLLPFIEGLESLLVLDEVYYEISDSYTLAGEVPGFDNLIVLRSLTKSYGLCGLRLGYAVADEEIIKVLDKARPPWNVNAIAQKAAAACIDHPYLKEIKKEARKSKVKLRQGLRKFPLKIYPSETNLVLINIKETGYSSPQLTELLLCKGVYVRDCSTFHHLDENYIRVGVKTPAENKILVEKIGEVLEG